MPKNPPQAPQAAAPLNPFAMYEEKEGADPYQGALSSPTSMRVLDETYLRQTIPDASQLITAIVQQAPQLKDLKKIMDDVRGCRAKLDQVKTKNTEIENRRSANENPLTLKKPIKELVEQEWEQLRLQLQARIDDKVSVASLPAVNDFHSLSQRVDSLIVQLEGPMGKMNKQQQVIQAREIRDQIKQVLYHAIQVHAQLEIDMPQQDKDFKSYQDKLTKLSKDIYARANALVRKAKAAKAAAAAQNPAQLGNVVYIEEREEKENQEQKEGEEPIFSTPFLLKAMKEDFPTVTLATQGIFIVVLRDLDPTLKAHEEVFCSVERVKYSLERVKTKIQALEAKMPEEEKEGVPNKKKSAKTSPKKLKKMLDEICESGDWVFLKGEMAARVENNVTPENLPCEDFGNVPQVLSQTIAELEKNKPAKEPKKYLEGIKKAKDKFLNRVERIQRCFAEWQTLLPQQQAEYEQLKAKLNAYDAQVDALSNSEAGVSKLTVIQKAKPQAAHAFIDGQAREDRCLIM